MSNRRYRSFRVHTIGFVSVYKRDRMHFIYLLTTLHRYPKRYGPEIYMGRFMPNRQRHRIFLLVFFLSVCRCVA